jgi:catechol 2,3-dioxygenase-like lactoylglutathione lyase family enzyme
MIGPMIRRLDHVNVRTANVSALARFYSEALGLEQGERPPLGFPGAWLYAGDQPVIHLVGAEEQPRPEGALRLEHFAFSASGLSEFLARLERLNITFKQSRQAGTGNVVIDLRDPDGNRLHVDFQANEAPR